MRIVKNLNFKLFKFKNGSEKANKWYIEEMFHILSCWFCINNPGNSGHVFNCKFCISFVMHQQPLFVGQGKDTSAWQFRLSVHLPSLLLQYPVLLTALACHYMYIVNKYGNIHILIGLNEWSHGTKKYQLSFTVL